MKNASLTTNQNWHSARRYIDKYCRPVLDNPTYIRKHLKPKVEIGCRYDHTQKLNVQPAIYSFKDKTLSTDILLAVFCAAALTYSIYKII